MTEHPRSLPTVLDPPHLRCSFAVIRIALLRLLLPGVMESRVRRANTDPTAATLICSGLSHARQALPILLRQARCGNFVRWLEVRTPVEK